MVGLSTDTEPTPANLMGNNKGENRLLFATECDDDASILAFRGDVKNRNIVTAPHTFSCQIYPRLAPRIPTVSAASTSPESEIKLHSLRSYIYTLRLMWYRGFPLVLCPITRPNRHNHNEHRRVYCGHANIEHPRWLLIYELH